MTDDYDFEADEEVVIEYFDQEAGHRRRVSYFTSRSGQWYRQELAHKYGRWRAVGVSAIDEPTIEVTDD